MGSAAGAVFRGNGGVMTRRYFGTDGIRGTANRFPMTAEMALKTAMATALALRGAKGPGAGQNRAVIGKDTRLSGYMVEQAMASGFVAMGMDVTLLGPIPTPGIAMLTRSLRADLGVMISASHNPYRDNGIKLFAADGFKLPDSVEEEIENLIDSDLSARLPESDAIGKAVRLDDACGRYVEYVKATFPRRAALEGMKIVIDCANGAAYKAAPQVLWELEAEVIPMAVSPDGRNINEKCGATHVEALQARVLAEKADLGIALDGDADRVIFVDEKGAKIDGDQILALLARHWHKRGRLVGEGVVATVMSNLGLERFLESEGIALIRTPVGDRYVVEKMRESGHNLGGEQSGHIVLSDYGTTGDGLVAALQVLAILKDQSAPASEVLRLFEPCPQLLHNVKFETGKKPLDDETVASAIRDGQARLARSGRVLVRPSGTEPLIRVMAEGSDEPLVRAVVEDICTAIEKAACGG